ncbi:type I-B CRISPR-associated protein Cas5b [Thermodesulfatator indicus]
MRIIAFKVWADFAFFRRHYTTSSPLSYSLPPPSALRGLVAAILGLSREEYPKILSPKISSFGVRLLTPVKKIRLGLNYLDTKDGSWTVFDLKKGRLRVSKSRGKSRLHTQVRVEFLKNPAYEIFFYHTENNLMDKFSVRLKAHQTVYTPYLGITECLANFEFLWDKKVLPASGLQEVISAFKQDKLKKLELREGTGLVREKLPLFIDEDRIRHRTEEVVFNPFSRPIWAELEEAWHYPDSNSVFALLE